MLTSRCEASGELETPSGEERAVRGSSAARVTFTRREYPLDLLVINTHFWTWEPRCLVVGPTMLHAKANLSLPTIGSVASLLPDAAVPEKIAVLLSFSAAVVGFLMPDTWDESLQYASSCLAAHLYPTTSLCHGGVDAPEEEPLSVVKLSRKLATDRSLMLAWDSKETIHAKAVILQAKHVYDFYRRERFGWLVDNVERDDALAKCAALNFSFVRYVKAFMP
ncbi:hypothetical protein V5799_030541 [Amblyomma americanum]|uniref:Uncharacterized protein n=1 Tax=Amblyomma americanum TaxID=6943 RepID=A0AAQ4EMU7_AMBAM